MEGTNEASVAASLVLYSLPGCGPARARWMASHPKGIAGALIDLGKGDMSNIKVDRPRGLTRELLATWTGLIQGTDVNQLTEAHKSLGEVIAPGHEFWCFEDDPEPPLFLHAVGKTELLTMRPSVAIVGTRQCTTVGRRFATKLGADLAGAGITVVSGLAKGIDGAAHAGTLAAQGRAIAVVASGLDVIYPRSNEQLWKSIGRDGLLLSEAPLGVKPDRWRFPARNRIIAALSDFVVVVESHSTGGALSTADEASLRGVAVGAVPGSVSSPASVGTNGLLVDGAIPIRHAQDVLDAIGIFNSPPASDVLASPLPGVGPMAQVSLSHKAQVVMDELQTGAVHIDALLMATRIEIRPLMALLGQLASEGLVAIDGSTVIATQQSVTPPLRKARL